MHWEIHPPRPSRFPSGGDCISQYIPPLGGVRIQYIPPLDSLWIQFPYFNSYVTLQMQKYNSYSFQSNEWLCLATHVALLEIHCRHPGSLMSWKTHQTPYRTKGFQDCSLNQEGILLPRSNNAWWGKPLHTFWHNHQEDFNNPQLYSNLRWSCLHRVKYCLRYWASYIFI